MEKEHLILKRGLITVSIDRPPEQKVGRLWIRDRRNKAGLSIAFRRSSDSTVPVPSVVVLGPKLQRSFKNLGKTSDGDPAMCDPFGWLASRLNELDIESTHIESPTRKSGDTLRVLLLSWAIAFLRSHP